MPLALLFILGSFAVADSTAVQATAVLKGAPVAGLLNLTSGKFRSIGHIFPADECKWSLGTGTQGQTSTMFYTNGTWFFLAQQTCGSKTNQTSLFGMQTLQSHQTSPYIREFWSTKSATSLNQMNVVWDWVCNIVVLLPQTVNKLTKYSMLMVSEFDSQVRPQATYVSEPADRLNGWVKVDGLAAMDQGDHQEAGWDKQEGNCGNKCALYTLERYLVDGKEKPPRALVGRNFHTAKLMSNLTDALQIQTMSYTHSTYGSFSQANVFIGLGLCCADKWCESKCKDHPGALSLFAYGGGTSIPVFLGLVNAGTALSKPDTAAAVRTGVLLDSPAYTPTPKPMDPIIAHVLVERRVQTYEITKDANGNPKNAGLKTTSPMLEIDLSAWVSR
jgi:hypothetical protein